MLNVSLNLILIPTMGVSGAAIAALVSYAYSAVATIVSINHRLGIDIDYTWCLKSFSLFGMVVAFGFVASGIAGYPKYALSIGVLLLYVYVIQRTLMDARTRGMVRDLVGDAFTRIRTLAK